MRALVAPSLDFASIESVNRDRMTVFSPYDAAAIQRSLRQDCQVSRRGGGSGHPRKSFLTARHIASETAASQFLGRPLRSSRIATAAPAVPRWTVAVSRPMQRRL